MSLNERQIEELRKIVAERLGAPACDVHIEQLRTLLGSTCVTIRHGAHELVRHIGHNLIRDGFTTAVFRVWAGMLANMQTADTLPPERVAYLRMACVRALGIIGATLNVDQAPAYGGVHITIRFGVHHMHVFVPHTMTDPAGLVTFFDQIAQDFVAQVRVISTDKPPSDQRGQRIEPPTDQRGQRIEPPTDKRRFGIELEITSPCSAYDLSRKITAAGIECRAEDYGHDTCPYWKIVSDGSITGGLGMEIVSPPLTGVEQVEAMCAVLAANGCAVNQSCGFHVHHEASDFANVTPFINLLKLYGSFELLLDAAMPPSRRSNRNDYCLSIRQRLTGTGCNDETGAEKLDRCETPEQVRSWLGFLRHHKINIESFWRQGTVEFRHHSGTINAEKVVNWIVLTQAFVEAAVSGRSGTDLREVLGAGAHGAIEHIERRIKHFEEVSQ